jgi:hypothetical protein
MANQLYPLAKEALLGGDLALDTDNIKSMLVREAYNAADQFLDDVIAAVATSVNLTTKTITLGTFDTDDIVHTAVGSGAAINYIILYQDTGASATSRLIAHIDTATGLPVTPDGTDITVAVNALGWFTL